MTDMETTEIKRGPGRPSLRANDAVVASTRSPVEDHAARAAARLKEIRAGASEENLDHHDDFYIPLSLIPTGWSYEWKTLTVLGKEDPYYSTTLRKAGWEPIPASRHPELMPLGYEGDTIIKKGMMLYERPLVLTQEARSRENRDAREAVRSKEEQLGLSPKGTMPRDADKRTAPRVSRSHGPVEIAD